MTTTGYAERRAAFMEQMGDAVAIFPAAAQATRSNDVEYRYRQDSDFYYLTGFPEPDSLCVLLPPSEKERFILFVLPRDPQKEIWNGRRYGIDGARETFGADAAHTIDKVEEVLSPILAQTHRVYYGLGRYERTDERILALAKQSRGQRERTGEGIVSLIDPTEILHEMRLHKSSGELALMRRAAAASAHAHRQAMRAARDGAYEYELEAMLEYHFRRLGGSGPAYPSIVASGANATILHYTTNDRQMRAGDLVLIDAGAEVGCYSSDVTRTFPVSESYSEAQRKVYEIVLRAQQDAIEMVGPGTRFDQVHQRATETLVAGMRDLGLVQGETASIVEKGEHTRFYMHRTSHWLGMDVHDVGKYRLAGESRELEAGMVLTVEPGIYIAEDAEGVDDAYRGIGVRIEDDVLVTADSHEVLTAMIPKEIEEVEAIRREALAGTRSL